MRATTASFAAIISQVLDVVSGLSAVRRCVRARCDAESKHIYFTRYANPKPTTLLQIFKQISDFSAKAFKTTHKDATQSLCDRNGEKAAYDGMSEVPLV